LIDPNLDYIVKNSHSLTLNESAIELLAEFLSVTLNHRSTEEKEADKRNTRNVLDAMNRFGYAVLPQGTVDAIKRLLSEQQELPK
jgi:hypothetical protein